MPRVKYNKNLTYSLKNKFTSRMGNTYDKHNKLFAWYQFSTDVSSSGALPDLSGNSRNLDPKTGGDRPGAPHDDTPAGPRASFGFPSKSAFFNQDIMEAGNPATDFNFGNGSNDSPLSVSMWIRLSSGKDVHYFGGKYDISDTSGRQWILYTSSMNGGSRQPGLFLYDSSTNKHAYSHWRGKTLETYRWYHFVVTYDGRGGSDAADGIRIFVDGEECDRYEKQTESGYDSMEAHSATKFSVGGEKSDNSNGFQGNFAEFAVWNAVLTHENVKALYDAKNGLAEKISGFTNLPPRIELRNRDNATGSYPTILRMGDKDRSGKYKISFNDENTMFFGRKIHDKFEVNDRNSAGSIPLLFPRSLGKSSVLKFSNNINRNLWAHTKGMQLRKERTIGKAGNTMSDGALVFAGPGNAGGLRYIQTRNFVKNATVTLDLIFGPRNTKRSFLGEGLGLVKGDPTETLKVMSSLTGAGPWKTVRTFTNDLTELFASASDYSFTEFLKKVNEQKRIRAIIKPTEFDTGDEPFYIRIVQDTIVNKKPVWALGEITIDSHNDKVSYPLKIDPSTRIGQKIVSGTVASPHTLPEFEDNTRFPGRKISGISDSHIKFTPGESIGVFDDATVRIDSDEDFFRQGSPPEILPGFSSPLWSKTCVEIDLTPDPDHLTRFGMTTKTTKHGGAASGAEYRGSYHEDDPTLKQQLMVYWNKDLKKWEKIAEGISHNAAASDGTTSDLRKMLLSGALGFSPVGLCSSGSSFRVPTQTTANSDVLNSYVRPTTVCGFPYAAKYAATSSQYILAKDIGITKPFLLEKCSISFDAEFTFATKQHDSGSRAYQLDVAHHATKRSGRTISNNQIVIIPTFFMLRQGRDIVNANTDFYYESGSSGFTVASENYVIPGNAKLAGPSSDLVEVDTSRDLITYGQVTLFTSGAKNYGSAGDGKGRGDAALNIDEVLEGGLERDSVIDILKEVGEDSTWRHGAQLSPITGSYIIDFPSRVSGKIPYGSMAILRTHSASGGGGLGALWFGNSIGGRSWGGLDVSARSPVNGTPTTDEGQNFIHFATDTDDYPEQIATNDAESMDKYSPYIILPTDKLVLGWQYPMTNKIFRAWPGVSDEHLNTMMLSGSSRLRLYGSQLKNNKEFHEGLNQNITSPSVHEAIGSETITDQFNVSRAAENVGNYMDSYVAASTEDPVDRIGATVLSRLTTPKGYDGAATGRISIKKEKNLFGSRYPGFNDGDRIKITDALGKTAYFHAHRTYIQIPTRGNGDQPHWFDVDGDGLTNDGGSNGAYPRVPVSPTDGVWASGFGFGGSGTNHYQMPMAGANFSGDSTYNGTFIFGASFAGASATQVGYPFNSSERPVIANRVWKGNSSGVSGDADIEYWAFRITGGGYSNTGGVTDNLFGDEDKQDTLQALKEAIESSHLSIDVSEVSSPSTESGMFVFAQQSFSINLTSQVVGNAGNVAIEYTYADDINGNLQDWYDADVQGMSGGDDQLEASKSSFLRQIPTRDGRRVYSDSLLTSGSYHGTSDASPPSLGTMQTEGSGIRPKYYLNTRRHGYFTDLLEQGKDSKTFASFATNRGVRRTIDNVSLGSPIKSTFVSGTISDSTGIRQFFKIASGTLPESLSNKTATYHISGSIFEDDPTASGTTGGVGGGGTPS